MALPKIKDGKICHSHEQTLARKSLVVVVFRKLKDPLIRFHYRARKDVPALLAARLKRARPFPPTQH